MAQTILAVIPARWGSQGIYQKNIRDVGGKPLIFYQTQVALDSKLIDEVVVATDSEEIAYVVNMLFGDKVEIVWRPANISGAVSKTEDTLSYVLDQKSADIIVTLQPTSPLNKVEYVDDCIQKVLDGCDSACCVVLDYGFFMDDKELLERPMRQDRKPRVRETGNCWVTKTDILKETNNRLGG
ncbi:hypothetical protein LCGC14_2389750, partial [marine sediment metagenome]